jgi:hypothetical protein
LFSRRCASLLQLFLYLGKEILMNLRKTIHPLLGGLILLLAVTAEASTAPVIIPNPVLIFSGQEFFTANGKDWIRYNYFVENFAAFPKELFAAAPSLPPCGANTKASRTWVDFYSAAGKRLNGFCALGNPVDLNKIWFALEEGVIPPSYVYIELNDRQTNTKYKSNLADTTL